MAKTELLTFSHKSLPPQSSVSLYVEPLYTTCSRSYYFYSISITHGHTNTHACTHTHIVLSISKVQWLNLSRTYLSIFLYLLHSCHLVRLTIISHGTLQLSLNNLTFVHALLIVNSLHNRQQICFEIIKQISPSFCLKFLEGLTTFTKNSKSLFWPIRHLLTQYPFLLLCSPLDTLALLF